jgi:LEA14-like dessication related protein
MKINKNYLVAGVIGVVTISGALLYLQYRKIMDYTLKFKRIKFNKISANLIDANIFLLLENKSSLKYTIKSQEYSIYVNDKFVSKLENNVENVIQPKSFSEIGLNVKINPVELASKVNSGGVLNTILSPEKVAVKIDMKLKVSFFGLTIKIPYVYLTNLKELTQPTKEM